jgi:hypothetical protein
MVSAPQFDAMPSLPGQMTDRKPGRWLTYFVGNENINTSIQLFAE